MTSSASSASSLTLGICLAEERLLLTLALGGVAPTAEAPPPGASSALVWAASFTAPGEANGLLAPALADGLKQLGLTREAFGQKLAGVACVRGPGSFTGLRMALAFGLGLARGHGAKLAGLSYLELLALAGGWATLTSQAAVAVCTRARRNLVYLQLFRPTPQELPSPLTEPLVLTPDQALEVVTPYVDEGPLLMLGSGAREHAERFRAVLPGERFLLAPPALDAPSADSLLLATQLASYGEAAVEPLYLRPSDAEENLGAIAAKRGFSPDIAKAELARRTGKA